MEEAWNDSNRLHFEMTISEVVLVYVSEFRDRGQKYDIKHDFDPNLDG